MTLSRKFALITGASAGIGVAFARLAAAKGFDLGIVARRHDRLTQIADEIARAHNVKVIPIAADLSDSASPRAIVDGVRADGRRIDVLINNAGYSIRHVFEKTTLDEQRAFMELTTMAPVALAHLTLPSMLEQGWGRIINVSSITAFSCGGKGHTLYPAGKSFLVKFSQSLSAEVKARGVFVTAVAPGFVDTEFQAANQIGDVTGRMPTFMVQTPSEIAEEAWRRNDRGTEVVVPGLLPKITAAIMKYVPEPLTAPLMRSAAVRHYAGD